LKFIYFQTVITKVVILGVWRLLGGPNGWAGGPVHYVWYELDILDIFFEYSFKIPRIHSNILEYFLVGRVCSKQGCHNGRFWMKITVRTSFSSRHLRTSTRVRVYPADAVKIRPHGRVVTSARTLGCACADARKK
jgi:hypothetical protein